MHQSIPAVPRPSPTLGLLWGICTPCQSRGWDICKFYAAWGLSICQCRGQPRPFDMHKVSYENITTQRILLEKQADWLICRGWEKTEEDWKKKSVRSMKNVVVFTEDGAFALVSFPPRGIWQLKSPHPGNLNARRSAWGGGGCCWPQLELTDG